MSFGKFKESEGNIKDKKVDSSTAKSKTSAITSSGDTKAYLGRGSKVVGNLTFEGPVELGGEIEGEVHASDTLIVGESALIKAKLNGTSIIIKGTVTGDITASSKLSLEKPAKVTGNISCPNLCIEEGVIFEGHCAMSSSGK